MRPAGPVPLTALRSTPWAAATRAATGVTLAPSGIDAVPASPAGRGADVGSGAGVAAAFGGAGAGGHAGEDLADRDGLAGLGEDLGDRAARRARASRRRPCRWRSRRSSRRPRRCRRRPWPTRGSCPRRPTRPSAGIDDVERSSPRPPARRPAASASAGASAPRRARRRWSGAISARTAPTSTVSPSATWIFTTVPEAGAGTSASTLSVEISTSVSSSAIVSPSCLCHSRMVPSETDSPIAGMTTSTVVLTAMSRSDHTAFRRGFLPAYAAFVVRRIRRCPRTARGRR